MPALVASRWEPAVQAFYEYLIDADKMPLQALVAVMRKLLHAIYGMFRHDNPSTARSWRPRGGCCRRPSAHAGA